MQWGSHNWASREHPCLVADDGPALCPGGQGLHAAGVQSHLQQHTVSRAQNKALLQKRAAEAKAGPVKWQQAPNSIVQTGQCTKEQTHAAPPAYGIEKMQCVLASAMYCAGLVAEMNSADVTRARGSGVQLATSTTPSAVRLKT
jgi:hypothetical protein